MKYNIIATNIIENEAIAELIYRIESEGWGVYTDTEDSIIEFSKYSPAGQDFSFEVDFDGDIKVLADNIYRYYNNYDPSEEAYYWLDSTGHGKNGAPYEMGDVYEDMKACQTYIHDLWELVDCFVVEHEEELK